MRSECRLPFMLPSVSVRRKPWFDVNLHRFRHPLGATRQYTIRLT